MSKLSIATRVAAVAGHVAREHMTKPMATTSTDVPRGPEAITKEWLTAVLCGDAPGAQVTGFAFGEKSAGSTSRGRIELTYNQAGQAAGLPQSVWFKSTPTLLTRLVSGLTGASENEGRFYTQIRPGLNLLAPQGYHGAADPASGRSIVLIEDIGRTRGASFGSALERYVTQPMAESMARELASYHGAMWNSPRFHTDLSWVLPSLAWQEMVNATIPFEKRTLIGIDRAADVSAPGFEHHRNEVWPAFMRSLELNVAGPITLLHQDQHPGNWFAAGDGEMGLYDWQCMARGGWALDFAYAFTAGLTVEDRRAWERGLLEYYLEQLQEAGGEPPEFDEAWLLYRQQVFHGLGFWFITIGAGRFQPDMQPVEISRVNLERMTRAAMDLESFAALNEPVPVR
jgi:phosphotransferase family enzyme